jgi:hypothetical protein
MIVYNPGDLVIAREEQSSGYTDQKSGERLYYWRIPAGAVGTVVADATAPNIPNCCLVDFGAYEHRAHWLQSMRAGVYVDMGLLAPFSMEYAMGG